VHAVGPGQTRVFAAAAFDELNVASTAVRVTVPASLQHVPSLPVDVQVGEVAPAAVKLLDSEGEFLTLFSTGFLSFSSIRFMMAKQWNGFGWPTGRLPLFRWDELRAYRFLSRLDYTAI
jgi:hypothetical protein